MNEQQTDGISPGIAGWTAFFSLVLFLVILLAIFYRPRESNERTSAEKTPKAVESSTAPHTIVPKTGRELYQQHCAACHGEKGGGNGIAATYLFPKPRDFRTGRFRLTSTKNVPTREDLEAVLIRGMPGSAMPPWAQLSHEDRMKLVDEVMRLVGDGAREQFVRELQEDEELDDDELAELLEEEAVQQEIDKFAALRTTPGDATTVPNVHAATAEAIARGKEIYLKQGCASCHGKEGRGDGTPEGGMFDDKKMPTSPRDFTLGIFKGGHDPQSLYRRIAYGMPGTPMPSSGQLTPEQNIDLVHFVRSLSDEATRQRTILKREEIRVKQVASVPSSPDADAWKNAPTTELRMTPLWWRNGADPDLRVQAVHDGKKIAFRVSWRDDTADDSATRSESFEDAVALELYRGDSEPFIGMGGPNSPVDVWYWDADRQGTPSVEEAYPNTVVDIYPFSEDQVDTAELDRPGANTSDQPEISLPARASGNPIIPSDALGASSLTVSGPGSVTFRLPKNRLVKAKGQWADGRWTVLLTRPLAVGSEGGVSLRPGDRASVALAVWDGSLQERDGRKLITIWQDLLLEGRDRGGPRPTRSSPPSRAEKTPKEQPKDKVPPKVSPKPDPARPDPTPRVAPPASDAKWGNLSGRFVFDGPAPEPAKLQITQDKAFCGKHNLVNESLLVNKENGGLANVAAFLYLKTGETAPTIHPSYLSAAAEKVRLENDGCRFEPRVCLVRTGQTLVIGNKDPVAHNTKVNSKANPPINPITPAGGSLDHIFDNEERAPVSVSCSIHSWMTAWIVVRESPYFATTDENGHFEIKNLPVGEWTFRFWHERTNNISEVVRDGQKESWRAGRLTVTIEPGENELGEIKVSPDLFK